MADSRELDVILQGKDNLSSVLDGAGSSLSGFHDAMQRSVDASQELAAGLLAVGASMVAFGTYAVAQANEAEVNAQRLTTVLLLQRDATLAQVDALRKLAVEIGNKTTLDDDAIVAGQSQLATFTLTAESIKNLTAAMVDLGVGINGVSVNSDQMQDVAKIMGKVMEGNTGILSRYGISITKTQEDLFHTGTETEKVTELTKILEERFGGLGVSMRSTTAGSIEAAKVAFGNMAQVIGEKLQPALKLLADQVTTLANTIGAYDFDRLPTLFMQYRETIMLVAGAVAGALAPAFVVAAAGAAGFLLALAPFAALGAGLVYLAQRMGLTWQEAFSRITEAASRARIYATEAEAASIRVYLRVRQVTGSIIDQAERAYPLLKSRASVVLAAIAGFWEEHEAMIHGLVDRVEALWSGGLDSLKATVRNAFNTINAFYRDHEHLIHAIAGAIVDLLIPSILAVAAAIGGGILSIGLFIGRFLLLVGLNYIWQDFVRALKHAWDVNFAGMQERILSIWHTITDFITYVVGNWQRMMFTIQYESLKFWMAHQEQIQGALTVFRGFITNVGETFGRLWFDLRFAALKFWTSYGDNITEFGQRVWEFAKTTWIQLTQLWDNVKGPLGNLVTQIGTLVGPLMELGGSVLRVVTGAFMNFITLALEGLKVVLPPVINMFATLISWIKQAVDWLNKFLKPLGDAVNNMSRLLGGADFSAQGFSDFKKGLGMTLGFSEGGIVPGVGNSDSVPALLTPGEEVLKKNDPRNARNGGSSGTTIHMPLTVYGSDRATAERVADLILGKLKPALTYAR